PGQAEGVVEGAGAADQVGGRGRVEPAGGEDEAENWGQAVERRRGGHLPAPWRGLHTRRPAAARPGRVLERWRNVDPERTGVRSVRTSMPRSNRVSHNDRGAAGGGLPGSAMSRVVPDRACGRGNRTTGPGGNQAWSRSPRSAASSSVATCCSAPS